jgi:hypothetical protein
MTGKEWFPRVKEIIPLSEGDNLFGGKSPILYNVKSYLFHGKVLSP